MQSGIPEILLLLGFTALCAAMGRALLIRIGFDFQSTLQAVSFSSGLGLAMLSWTVLALGFLGGLSRTSAAVVAAVVSLLGIISLAYWVAPRIRRTAAHPAEGAASAPDAPNRPLASALLPGLFVAAFGLLATFQALAPEVGIDALNYHLGLPGMFLRHGRIATYPEIVTSSYPLFTEMLFTFGLALGLPIFAKAFSWLMGILTLTALYGIASQESTPRASLLACAIFVSTPAVVFQMGTANVEPATGLYLLLSFWALLRYRDERRIGWLILAAMFAGICASTKYTAFIFPPVLAWIAWRARRQNETPGPADLLRPVVFLSVSLLPLLPWLLRNLAEHSNPVYPFCARLFGAPVQVYSMMESITTSVMMERFGMGRGVADLLLLPVRQVMEYKRFGGYSLGAVYLLSLPLVLLSIRRLQPHVRKGLVVVAAGFLFFALTTHQNRLITPILPLLSLAIACAAVRPKRPAFRGAVLALLLVLMIFNLPWLRDLIPYARLRSCNPPVGVMTGAEAREDYFKSRWPGRTPLFDFMNAELSPGSIVMAIENAFRYKLPCCEIWDNATSPAVFNIQQLLTRGKSLDVLRRMRSRKIDYILVNEYVDSILFETFLYNSLAPKIYDRSGFVLRSLDFKGPLPQCRSIAPKEFHCSCEQILGPDPRIALSAGISCTLLPDENAVDLLVLYWSAEADAGPAIIDFRLNDELIVSRRVPHQGWYHLDGPIPQTLRGKDRLELQVEFVPENGTLPQRAGPLIEFLELHALNVHRL